MGTVATTAGLNVRHGTRGEHRPGIPSTPGRSARRPDAGTGRPALRSLHPWAWWGWALGAAVCASLTTHPVFLLLLGTVLVLVVLRCRGDSPWARAIWAYVALAGVVVLIRVLFTVVLGSGGGTTVLFALPRVPLPDWAAGVTLGGPVTAERLLASATDALRLGLILVAVGAANALANPKRALRSVPSALYDVSVAVVIAVTVAPQLVESALRVRRARRLRGGSATGLRAVRAIAIPVLEDAVDRSLALAAAMESRGYGRTRTDGEGHRRLSGSLLVASLVFLGLGTYLLLSAQASVPVSVVVLVLGAVCTGAGLVVSGRRLRVTHYRPDPWRWPEWVTVACGVLPAVALAWWLTHDPLALQPPASPLHWPGLVPGLGTVLLVVALPGLVARPPGRRVGGRR